MNEIANLAFVAGKTNRVFSNEPPSQYSPSVIAGRGIEALTTQRVPADTACTSSTVL